MMKAKNNFVVKFGKLLLVFCTLFSQLSFSLEVFAEEVVSSLENSEAVTALEDSALEDDTLSDSDENTTTNETTDENLGTDGDVISGDGTDDDVVVDDTTDDSNTGSDDGEVLEATSVEILAEDQIANIQGTFKIQLTVSMVKDALALNYSDSVIYVLFDGQSLGDDTIVTNGMELDIDGVSYAINVYGDYNLDGIVNQEDIDYIIEDILGEKEEEETSVFDINDVTYISSSVKNGSWIEKNEVTDEVSFSVVSEPTGNVLVDDTLEVMLYVNELEVDTIINGIEGIVDYDDTLLELESIKVLDNIYDDSELDNKNEEGKFVYLLNDYKNDEDGLLITLTFKALMVGDANISFEDLALSYNGSAFNLVSDCNFAVINVTINPAGIGGDDDSNISGEVTDEVIEETFVEKKEEISYIIPTYVNLSRNNYISGLEIKGYDINFDRYTYEYSITVSNDVSSLDLTVVLDSSSASYVINGNDNFKEGKNVVEIVVTAEDGTTRTYTINVDKEEKEEDASEEVEEEKESNVSKTVIIVLIILVIIGLIYVIFKDDEEDEGVSKDNKRNVSSTNKSNESKKNIVNTKKVSNTKKNSNKSRK